MVGRPRLQFSGEGNIVAYGDVRVLEYYSLENVNAWVWIGWAWLFFMGGWEWWGRPLRLSSVGAWHRFPQHALTCQDARIPPHVQYSSLPPGLGWPSSSTSGVEDGCALEAAMKNKMRCASLGAQILASFSFIWSLITVWILLLSASWPALHSGLLF